MPLGCYQKKIELHIVSLYETTLGASRVAAGQLCLHAVANPGRSDGTRSLVLSHQRPAHIRRGRPSALIVSSRAEVPPVHFISRSRI